MKPAKPLPRWFYSAPSRSYWWEIPGGRFLEFDKRDVQARLLEAGIPEDEHRKEFVRCQDSRCVDYAGPLAGHQPGPVKLASGRVALVTEGFRLPAPKPGKTDRIDKLLGELLDTEIEQSPYYLSWLAISLDSLRAGDLRPGQMVVFAGPGGCGKSLLQSLTSYILGGRAAKPYRYMSGITAFNGDLAEAETLVIEDESASTDIRARRRFGASVKEFTVCSELSIHAKGRQAVTLPRFCRLTLSVNDEPENLSILPPWDPSIADKVMLFQCRHADVGEKRGQTWKGLTDEVPALVARLDKYQIPKALRDDRFGVTAWHHPELVAAISGLSPERSLLNILEAALFPDKADRVASAWEGTATELSRELRSSQYGPEVSGILTYPSAIGVYLSRLERQLPERFQSRTKDGRTRWKVSPPPKGI